MSAGLGQDLDQLVAHFLRQLRQVLFPDGFDIIRPANAVE